MLVHDHDDGVVPVSEARRLRAALPNARLLLTRGLRHGRVLTDPNVLVPAVDFLLGRGY